MTEDFLVKIFKHNNWANQKTIEACYALTDEQLDVEPHSVTKGTIRRTLVHMVSSQESYLRTLTVPVEERLHPRTVPFAELEESARRSGEGLLALASGEQKQFKARLKTRDGYYTALWVVMLQVINHATEHREQIKSMMSALGVTPPDVDGWDYGIATNTMVPISTE